VGESEEGEAFFVKPGGVRLPSYLTGIGSRGND